MSQQTLNRGGVLERAFAPTLGAGGGPIEIVEHDPHWVAAYRAERERLGRLLPGVVLHHIGSTSVPGLAAKPIVDIAALVPDLDEAVRTVSYAGYVLPAEFNAGLKHRRYLCYPTASYRTHHLHLVDRAEDLEACLRFRDALAQNPRLAEEYVALKRALAARFRADRHGYTAAKSEFIGTWAAGASRPAQSLQ
jgi:GrpB-like predicted nucleotidyltransferase (UPF0157 family)